RAGESGAPRELVLTQDDIRQVQLAKGAIASGIAMLQHVAGVPDARVGQHMLSGGFGNYLPIASAWRLGLLPVLPPERIRYVTHPLTTHRPPRAAATLHPTARGLELAPRRSGTLVVSRFETVDARGEKVSTTDYGSVYRDVGLAGVIDDHRQLTAVAPGGGGA